MRIEKKSNGKSNHFFWRERIKLSFGSQRFCEKGNNLIFFLLTPKTGKGFFGVFFFLVFFFWFFFLLFSLSFSFSLFLFSLFLSLLSLSLSLFPFPSSPFPLPLSLFPFLQKMSVARGIYDTVGRSTISKRQAARTVSKNYGALAPSVLAVSLPSTKEPLVFFFCFFVFFCFFFFFSLSLNFM